jgi:DNA-binding SARP family transcriptional activator/predicted ATPase
MKRYGGRMAAALEISLLGPPVVRVEGRPVAFDTRKAIALLAHLALAGRPRSRELLCELLWPDHDPDRARGALRRTLSVVRKAIGEDWLETVGGSVAMREGEGLAVDVRRFRSLTAPSASADELAEGVELFRGELLEGFSLRENVEFDAWLVYEADLLRRELAAALARLVSALLERREHRKALEYARRWVALDPLHEPAQRELIRLCALTGDRAAALAQYRDCVRVLSRELGVAPVEETAALFEQISEGTLAPRSAPTAAAEVVAGSEPTTLPLVGRADELATLLNAYATLELDGRLVVIEGESGIGKTRLARELTAHVAERGGLVLAACCHEDEAEIPYGPVIELLDGALQSADPELLGAVPSQRLADAALLLPELATIRSGLPNPVAPADPGAQARLLGGVAAVLSVTGDAPHSGVVFVDDVHAADAGTLDALSHLARHMRGRRLLLVLSWRTENVPPGHRLRRLAGELSRERVATMLRLDRLTEDETASLVRSVRPDTAPGIDKRVYAESEGLPLFVAEYLAAVRAGSELAGRPLPHGLRELLEARVAGLGAIARQLLETAAVLGRSFDLDTLRAASGRGEDEAANGLEELLARGLVREQSGAQPAYDFAHGKLREFAYDAMSLARRRLLHRRAAEAILYHATGSESAALAATHLRLAGDQVGAAEQHRRAAEHAVTVLAHRDALTHLDAALALGDPNVAELHEQSGDLRTLIGDYAAALASYEHAAAECDEPGALARLEHKLGGVHARRGEWDRAQTRFALALETAPPGEEGLHARILADLSLSLHHAGDPQRSLEVAEKARALADSAADKRAQAQAHNLLGILARETGQLDLARAELEHSLALAKQLANTSARIAALNNLALVARDAGETNRALELTSEALELCAAQGDRHRQAALENNLADLHHAAGSHEESMTHLKRAVALFAEIGADEDARLPEIWKLVSW